MDTVAWGALTLTLTALGAVYTYWAFRNRSAVAGLRGVGLTLLPLGLLLTDTLRMVTRIANAVGSWVGNWVWSPMTWVGLIVLGVSMTSFVLAGVLRGRQVGTTAPAPAKQRAGDPALAPSRGRKAAPAVADEDMADIEALLKRRGIE